MQLIHFCDFSHCNCLESIYFKVKRNIAGSAHIVYVVISVFKKYIYSYVAEII